MTNKKFWLIWVVLSSIMMTYLIYKLYSDDKSIFLPGETSHGHHQIELACAACHADSFAGGQALQDSCVSCHSAELKQVDDSHPRSKFTNPRNIDRVKSLDARVCITCHVEHKPEITSDMLVTVPQDFCVHCHLDVAEDRPSHSGMAFDSCASSGCHNFHDNSGLYEDFIAKHVDEPANLDGYTIMSLSEIESYLQQPGYPVRKYPNVKIDAESADMPNSVRATSSHLDKTFDTSHSRAGVNCSGCHGSATSNSNEWTANPGHETCRSCHRLQVDGFLDGMHGMRLRQDLPPMSVAMSQLPMKTDANHKILGCQSCHSSHSYDRVEASTNACLTCHDDEHSKAFELSLHANITTDDKQMSCATCHLPRREFKGGGKAITFVDHNQNNTLRPNEKMLRPVCMNCHGYSFSVDALSDRSLIENNFRGMPSGHVDSVDLVKERMKTNKKRK